ncbi:hypothetical protein QOZ80_5AG0367490 [Eleusine coracana subsp. coracana]|nr:hypothetical protein QOZ80_5AG0367490 [Eleusine coracana subsp. coracana]
MEVIFGNGLVTGKFAMGSSEPLGSPSDFAESSLKTYEVKGFGEPSKNASGGTVSGSGPSGSGAGNKRKRGMITDDDIQVMSDMTDAVNNMAQATRETKVEDSHPDLYGVVMFMPGFTEEALIIAYSHLLDNRAHGTAFVNMTDRCSPCALDEDFLGQALLCVSLHMLLLLVDPYWCICQPDVSC